MYDFRANYVQDRDKQRHLGPHLVQCNKLPEIKIVAVVRAHICFLCAEITSPMEVREHTVPAPQSRVGV